MKFAIVSLNNDKIRKIIQILGTHCHDMDTSQPDFVITLGGDGTVLYSERKYPCIPKITVRGSKGGSKCLYTESELEDVLLKIEDGEYKLLEERKLDTRFQEKSYLSLNEVQLHNSSPIKAIRFSIYVNNLIMFDNIIGDGVVIATPFGSTAYYSSIGGKEFNKGIGIGLNNPYKFRHRRPVIVDEDSRIHIEILRDDGLLLFDNDDKIIKVKGGDEISVKNSRETAKFVII